MSKKPSASGRKHYGAGLYLQTTETGSASWLLRYQRQGRERWMGLGPKGVFTLTEARDRARKAQQQIYDGLDPLAAKREQRALQELEASRSVTFADAAQLYYDQHEAKWTSAKHRQEFLSSLKRFAYPVIGKLPVAAVDTAAVLKIIEPIWLTKNQTASRVRGRIEAILDWAKIRKYRDGDNPAKWEGYLDQVLPTGGSIAKVEHHAALPYADVPGFVAELSKRQGIGPKAMTFIILAAARTGEVLGARWPEFDFDTKVWTIPAERMKGRKGHRVPLTAAMIKLLKELPREGGNDLVFIGGRTGARIGKMTLPKLIESIGANTTTHGFRSSFRDWAAESTSYPREVIEQCLAHSTGTDVELAYKRTDLLAKRAKLMEAWNTFITSPVGKSSSSVTPIRRKAGA